jgi:hypothetical protein
LIARIRDINASLAIHRHIEPAPIQDQGLKEFAG